MKFYRKVMDAFYSLLKVLTVAAVVAMLAIMTIEVVRRYIFGLTWTWSDEIIRHLLLFTTFLGGAAAYKNGALVCFDLLSSKLPPKRKAVLEIFNNSACLIFSMFILILSIRKIMMPSMHNQISVNTGLAIFIPYLSIPIGMTFIVLFSINNYGELINRLKTAFKGQKGGGEQC